MSNYNKVIDALLEQNAIKATEYLSAKSIIRAVRKTYKFYGKKPRKGENIEITLTIGKPNYVEREFIKLCVKAGEPFPVKKVQLKFPPVKRKLAGRKQK